MVTVVMSTWDDGRGIRHGYMQRCLESWWFFVDSNIGWEYIIADDGSEVVPEIKYSPLVVGQDAVRLVTGPHNGIGASLNRALSYVAPGQPWIYTTDDWKLPDPNDDSFYEGLNLGQALQLIQRYDIVRLGPVHPNLKCTTKFEVGVGWWLEIDSRQEGYPFGTRPFLANYNVIRALGAFPEGTDSYVFENWFNQRCQDIGFSLASVALHGPWEHIGEYEVGDRPVV